MSPLTALGAAVTARWATGLGDAVAGPALSVLIFHRVLPMPDPLFPAEIDVQRFRRLMRLTRRAFVVLPLREAVRRLQDRTLPGRSLAITFDDGYADNFEHAMPVLQEMALPATVFVTTGCLDGGRMWNDTVIECIRKTSRDRIDAGFAGLGTLPVSSIAERRRAIARLLPLLKYRPPSERTPLLRQLLRACGEPQLSQSLMMTSEQVSRLPDGGLAVGAHTVSHPILQSIDDREAEAEIRQGRARLEEIVQQPVPHFAYPNGRPGPDYGPQHVDMARKLGFDAAVSTAPGTNLSSTDLFQLRRFTPWQTSDLRWMLGLGWNHIAGRTSVRA